MSANILLCLACVCALAALIEAGGHGGGGHKKVVVHVPIYGGGGGDDHYEVLGYTYGEPKAAPHGHGGGWHAADEGHAGDESPVSFEGDSGTGYGLSGAGGEYQDEHSGY
ncbi:hypothetical protein NE865_01292 [Phthorimaea operculella]|nr:hypothetical protein NE865_01292 [Phthorimaea operculella]